MGKIAIVYWSGTGNTENMVQIPLERHAHSANGGMRLPDYSA